MFYPDTSILVAALTNEVETLRMQAWLVDQEAVGSAISVWVTTEVAAALSMKLRRGDVHDEERTAALAAFAHLAAPPFTMLPITHRQFELAAELVNHSPMGLRAGDALHLAIAADAGITLATLDRRQAEAGAALGTATILL